MRLQDRHGVRTHGPDRQARGARDLLDEVVHQLRHVVATLGKRRHAQRHDRQAMEQVLAEAAILDLVLQVTCRRRDDAHVDLDLGGAVDALEALLDQDAQDLALRLPRHVGDLVEVERAAMRLLERADDAGRARAVLDAEQLLLHPVRRNRGGVEDDERAVHPQRGFVNRTGDQFLARARRPRDHDAAVGRRDPFDRLLQMVDGDRRADEAAGVAGPFAQVAHFAAQLRRLQRALGDQQQAVGLERLLDIVVGTAPDGRDGRLDVAVAGNHHHRQIGVLRLDDVEQRQTVDPAAGQPDVEENERRAALLDLGEGGVSVTGGTGAVALVFENSGDEPADVSFIIDDQNIGRHDLYSRQASTGLV